MTSAEVVTDQFVYDPIVDQPPQMDPQQIRLIEDHLHLIQPAVHWAQRHRNNGHIDTEEARGDAHVGLCRAAQAYNPAYGVTFGHFANFYIRGAIIDGERTFNGLGGENRRQPRVVSLLNRTRARSLDEPLIAGTGFTLHNVVSDPTAETEHDALKNATVSSIYEALSEHLTERQLHIFRLKSQRQTLAMIAAQLGISERTVSRDYRAVAATVLAKFHPSLFD